MYFFEKTGKNYEFSKYKKWIYSELYSHIQKLYNLAKNLNGSVLQYEVT